MRNSELVLYLLKVHFAIHMLGSLKYSQYCDPAGQELAGHLRLLVWVSRLLEAEPYVCCAIFKWYCVLVCYCMMEGLETSKKTI